MQLRTLSKEENGVSPVIGVILMVAITVILAAVIGAFVIGIGDDQSTVPQASWDFDQSTEALDFQAASNSEDVVLVDASHQTGASVDDDNIDVTVNGETAWSLDESETEDVYELNGLWDSGDSIAAGSSVQVAAYSDDASEGEEVDDYDTTEGVFKDDGTDRANALESGDTIRIVWTSDDGGDSSVLADYEVN